MRIYEHIQTADAKAMSRQGESGFTMVEIALAIGVIGFALVAIIGILPAGLNVQKDVREDTVVSQDAPFFMDAIRNGVAISNGYPQILVSNAGSGYSYYVNTGQGLDFLTNYVQAIRFDNISNWATNTSYTYSNFFSGAEIIGLLTTPQINYNSPYFASNYFDVTATVRALSGPASAQQNGPNSGMSSSMAFTYQMEVMVTPFNSFAPDSTNWSLYTNIAGVDTNQVLIRYNRWLEASNWVRISSSFQPFTGGSGGLQFNLFDVRLRFSWPVLQNGNVGPGRQTYRTLIASQMVPATVPPPPAVNGVLCWFFQPQTFTNSIPTNSVF